MLVEIYDERFNKKKIININYITSIDLEYDTINTVNGSYPTTKECVQKVIDLLGGYSEVEE